MRQRIIKAFLVGALSLVLTFGMVACGKDKPDPNSPDTLDVYLYNAGYGYKWCDELLKEFEKQAWVKEKYPNIKINFEKNELDSYASTQLSAGSSANKYDLIFGPGLQSYYGPTGDLLDLTGVVYGADVPGESVKVNKKMFESYVVSNAYNDVGVEGDPSYYSISYASGMTGIVYNETVLNALGIAVPRTTDELCEAMDTIRGLKGNSSGKYDKGYSFLTYGASAYSNYFLEILWAQYETSEEFINFYNGVDSSTNSISPEVFRQKGRLESLKVIEEIYKLKNGNVYLNPNSGRDAYIESQSSLIMGNGVFMANGDWFDYEMSDFAQGLKDMGQRCDTIKMMRTPIISSLRTKTPSITSDAMLRQVVDAIDGGAESFAGVTEEDFNVVRAARSVVYSIGSNHNAVIPKYAAGKDIAVDFMRFMATDIANEIYIKSTNGASLPYNYDLKSKNQGLYDSISAFQRNIMDYFNGFSVPVDILPYPNSFPLVRFGGLNPFKSVGTFPAQSFTQNKLSAKEIYDSEYKYWTEDGNNRWNTTKSKAGMA